MPRRPLLSDHRSGRTPRKARRGARRRLYKPTCMRLNLTAMIDVVFQLLIYFVVTAGFAQGEGVLRARLPGASAGSGIGPPPPSMELTVHVASAGAFAYRLGIDPAGATPASFHELAQTLERLKAVYGPETPVVIQPDRQVRWQHVVNAFNAAVKARYEHIAFAHADE